MATIKSIDLEAPEHREMVAKISRFASRISGDVTVATLINVFYVLPEEGRPSRELIKAYVKAERG